MVALSFFMKLPQVLAILRTGRTEGVNLRTYWMEIGAYLIGFFYGYTYGYHLSTYMEAGLLAVQSACIIFLVMYYEGKWTLENALYSVVIGSFVTSSFFRLVPLPFLKILLSLTLPLTAGSKLAQIGTVYRLKSKGNVSVLAWSLAAYGCFARLFTTFVEVGDVLIFLKFLMAAGLNSTVVALCLFYSHREEKNSKEK